MTKYSPEVTSLAAFTWLEENKTNLEEFIHHMGDPPTVNGKHPLYKYSILDCAALNGNLPAVSFLLDHGANTDLPLYQRTSRYGPLHNAIKGGGEHQVGVMRFVTVFNTFIDRKRELLAHGPIDLACIRTTKSQNDRTYLMEIILSDAPLDRRLQMLGLLLDNGADPNQRTKYGTTALFWCAIRGEVECAQFLVERGADKKVRSGKGESIAERARYTLRENKDSVPPDKLKAFIEWAEQS